MTSVFIQAPLPDNLLLQWEFDAVVSENDSFEAEVSEYAVEEGSDTSDNISVPRETLSLSGVLTGARIGGSADEMPGRQRLAASKQMLKEIMALRTTVTLVTPSEIYKDMAISSAATARTSEHERLEVTLTLKKIRKAQAREADVPAKKTSGSATAKAGKTEANGGKTTGKPADPPPREQTALAKLTKGGKSVADVIGGP